MPDIPPDTSEESMAIRDRIITAVYGLRDIGEDREVHSIPATDGTESNDLDKEENEMDINENLNMTSTDDYHGTNPVEVSAIFPCTNPADTDLGVMQYDPVDRPAHYCEGRRHEPIDIAEDWNLDEDAYLFNVLKYISRAGRKGPDKLEDLRKARFYLDRRIQKMEREGQ